MVIRLVIALALGGGAAVLLAMAWARQSDRARAEAHLSAEVEGREAPKTPLAGLEGPASGPASSDSREEEATDPHRVEIDLGAIRVSAAVPPLWRQVEGTGTFLRDSAAGAFLTDTLLITSSCLGDCKRVRKNLSRLARAWSEEFPALAIRFKVTATEARRLGPGVAEVVMALDTGVDTPGAWVHGRAIHPEGAAQAIVCWLLVFGDRAALDKAAEVCATVAIAGPEGATGRPVP
jgi:hypothetical protein